MKRNEESKVFQDRLTQYMDELRWLYFELYHSDEKAFDYFLQVLESYYNERSEDLKAMDALRTKDTNWYRKNEMLGMLMYVDCFAGTINGVREKLDYIKDAGVNYVHLMPLLQSPREKSDGGYAVSDFRNVDPKLGTMEDLENLAKECHQSGMSLCIDFVMNHTSEEHEWALRAKSGETEYQNRYFFFENRQIPDQFEKTVPQVFPTTAPGNFTWCEEAKKFVMTTFYPYQWDLNYANPTVFNDMTANMLNLCNHGVDVIRLDAVPYIWKSLGTPCRNLLQVHTLVRMMRIACEIVCPGTLLLGEVVMEPSKVVPYFGSVEKPECQVLYNVTTMATTWHTVATRDVRLMKHQLAQVFALPKEYTFLNYLRCHDDIGWGLDYEFLKSFGMDEAEHKKFLNDYFRGYAPYSDARGELYNDDPKLRDARLCGTTASLCGIEAAEFEKNEAKLNDAIALHIMLHAFLFTQSGIPVIYSGDEIAMLNDYSYHEDEVKNADSRYLHRGRFDWTAATKRKSVKSKEGRVFKALRKLEKIRAKYKVFESGADAWVIETYNQHVLGIGRYYKGEKLIALFNFSPFEQMAWINEVEEYKDLISGAKTSAKGVLVEGYGFKWMITKFK